MPTLRWGLIKFRRLEHRHRPTRRRWIETIMFPNPQIACILLTPCYRLVFFYFLFLRPFNSFFSSPSSFRCNFFTSSAGGRFSGTIPLCVSISNSKVIVNMFFFNHSLSFQVFALYIQSSHLCR